MLMIEVVTVCCCPTRDRNVKEVPNRMEKPAKKKRKSLILGSLLRTSIDTSTAGQSGLIKNKDLKDVKDDEYCNCH